jgi:hypothetical protein
MGMFIEDNARPGEAAVLRMQAIAGDARDALQTATLQAFHMLWDDPASLQYKLDVMGTKAATVFAIHRLTIVYLLQVGAVIDPADYTPPYEVVEHPDGRVTAIIPETADQV